MCDRLVVYCNYYCTFEVPMPNWANNLTGEKINTGYNFQVISWPPNNIFTVIPKATSRIYDAESRILSILFGIKIVFWLTHLYNANATCSDLDDDNIIQRLGFYCDKFIMFFKISLQKKQRNLNKLTTKKSNKYCICRQISLPDEKWEASSISFANV